MNKLTLIFLALLSFNATADVTVTATLGDPVAGVPVDEVLVWCDPVANDYSDPVSITDMVNITHTYKNLPDGVTKCRAQAVSNVNPLGTPSSSNFTPDIQFEVEDGSVKHPNMPAIQININIMVGAQ